MRIVYLNPVGRLGGAETSLRELLASMRAAEPDWQLYLVLGEDGPLAEIARQLGIEVVVKPFPARLARFGDSRGWSALIGLVGAVAVTPAYAFSLAHWLRDLRPQVVHTNGFKMHLLGAWTRPRGTALVWHVHDYVGPRKLMSRLLRLFYRACSVAVVNSKSVLEDLRKLLPKLPAVTVYNAVDLERFSPFGTTADLDACAGLPAAGPGIVRVGLVATFARWKGHGVFLEALAHLPAELPIRGYVIGGPIYQTQGSQWSLVELQRVAESLGLAGRVGFTGFLQDVPAAMRALDVIVHASTDPEPFGMVIVEGMACGKAVIASKAGGATEIFEDGRSALGHAAGDALSLQQQILRLVRDPELRRRLGAAGREKVEHTFEKQRLARQLIGLYRQNCSAPTQMETTGATCS